MGSDRISIHWITAAGDEQTPPAMNKPEAARWLLQHAETLFSS